VTTHKHRLGAGGAGFRGIEFQNDERARLHFSGDEWRRETRLDGSRDLLGRGETTAEHGVVAKRCRVRERPELPHSLQRSHDSMHANRRPMHRPTVLFGALDK
jgi:hypothetical protein